MLWAFDKLPHACSDVDAKGRVRHVDAFDARLMTWAFSVVLRLIGLLLLICLGSREPCFRYVPGAA